MSARIRIETIRLIGKMEQNGAYNKKLGICDVSRFHGVTIAKHENSDEKMSVIKKEN